MSNFLMRIKQALHERTIFQVKDAHGYLALRDYLDVPGNLIVELDEIEERYSLTYEEAKIMHEALGQWLDLRKDENR